MTKQESRKIFRDKRRQLTAFEILKYDDLMLIEFQRLDLPFLSCVHTYLSLEKEKEIDTSAFIRYLNFRNPSMITVVPKIDFNKEEIHQVLFNDEAELVLNRHGIEEPVEDHVVPADETDLVFVPLLAYDKNGYRVGYGKGYYDRFLVKCREDVIKIGFSYFPPVDQLSDVNHYDIPLNYCITPKEIYSF